MLKKLNVHCSLCSFQSFDYQSQNLKLHSLYQGRQKAYRTTQALVDCTIMISAGKKNYIYYLIHKL